MPQDRCRSLTSRSTRLTATPPVRETCFASRSTALCRICALTAMTRLLPPRAYQQNFRVGVCNHLSAGRVTFSTGRAWRGCLWNGQSATTGASPVWTPYERKNSRAVDLLRHSLLTGSGLSFKKRLFVFNQHIRVRRSVLSSRKLRVSSGRHSGKGSGCVSSRCRPSVA